MSEPEPKELKRPGGNPAPDTASADDAGTQALSEALRSSFIIVRVIMIGLVLVFLGSGFFTVDAQHKAIILRLGRPVGEGEAALLGPGLHFAFPRPIDEVVKIPFTSSQTADSTVGWYQSAEDRAKGASKPAAQAQLDPATISYVLTADTNIIHVVATATYRITDPVKFHFDFADAAVFVTNDLNNALLFTASHFNVDDALTFQRTAFTEAVEARMRELVAKQDLGVTVDLVNPATHAPLFLENDFNRVAEVRQEAEDTITKARASRTEVLGRARGDAASLTNSAEVAKSRMVELIGAEQTNFSKFLPDYERDPELVRRLLLAETFKRVWANADLTEVLPNLDGRQLRFHLSGPATPFPSATTNQPGK
jgi:membrane protease subunit HflK